MVKEGRIIYCDRCGVSTFEYLNKIATKHYGVATYHEKDYMKNVGGKYLCQHCYAVYNTMIRRFMDGERVDIPEVESMYVKGSDSGE